MMKITRRDALKGLGFLVVGLAVPSYAKDSNPVSKEYFPAQETVDNFVKSQVTREDVANIQIFLDCYQNNKVDIDGVYGKQTTKSVIYFQEKNGLKIDGLAGKKTLAAMIKRYERDPKECAKEAYEGLKEIVKK